MKKIYIVSIVFVAFSNLCFAQGTWTLKANFPGTTPDFPFTFSIGNKGYIGTGRYGGNSKEFWEFDPATNVWTQKADYGGGLRCAGTGFSIGNKGYAGIGTSTGGFFDSQKDFWEYDPATNIWTQKADFGGGKRCVATGFSIQNYGYLATGADTNVTLYNDLWQYDPVADTWTQKASLPGVARYDANGFSIGTNGYVVAGNGGGYLADLWEYNSITDTWLQKANFPGSPRWDGAAIAVCNYGYFGTGEGTTGHYNDWWQYDPAVNVWTQKAILPGQPRDEPGYFAIGNKGYVGLGSDNNFNTDFYEFTPDSACSQCTLAANFISSDTAFCDELGQCINFTDLSTCNPTSWHWLFPGAVPDTSNLQNPTNICYYTPGTYPVTLIVADSSGSDTLAVNPLIIFANLPPPPTINVIGGDTLMSSHGAAYQWYLNGSLIGGATDSFYVALQGGTYSVQVTNNLGCTSLSSGVFITGALSIQNLAQGIYLYPNPVRETLVISVLSLDWKGTFEIYNVLGERFYDGVIDGGNQKQETINCKQFPSGIYFVRLITKGESYIAKFVKE